MRAGFLLDYLVQEVGPFAYNRGVADAEAWVRAGVDELPATCFADGLTYWKRRP